MEKQKNGKTVAMYTLGCKVNQYETNAMMQLFEKSGYKIVSHDEKADIYVINTCTVTNIADKKSRQTLRKAKEMNPEAIVVAVGCYAQVAGNELSKIEEIDLVLGNLEKTDIIKYIEEYAGEVQDVMHQVDFIEFNTTAHTEKTRAVIKVQDGCDRFCSYCIIPYARGRVRSRKPENIISEVKEIAKDGIKEIVITGIHVSSYGKDFKEEYRLINLLKDLNEVEGIERIRLSSLEPRIITEEFIQELKKLKKVCNNFHLSLQSGCDETLQRMNRKYTTEEFENITNIIRKEIPNVILTTDIIVGFPGETEEEFNKTYEFLKKINFYKMHVFKYSPRKGTKAATMENQISSTLKEERSKKLINLSNENEENILKTYIGKEVEVLFEQNNQGHTTNYLLVKRKNDATENTIQNVKVLGIEENMLIAE